MQILENYPLKAYNSFGIEAKARHFANFESVEQLSELLAFPAGPGAPFILGGGSNILFTRDYDGIVLKNSIKKIEELHEDAEYVYVRAGAGENWNNFVQHCIQKNWAGLENLSLIPGNVGASPMQNIGAYGVELQDLFWDLEAFHLREKKIHTFTRSDCEFGYRDSVFKNKYKNEFAILNVTFRLRKNPVFHISYGAIQDELSKMGVQDLSIQSIAVAVINIRQSKLPDPQVIGNAGSFFKNPTVTKAFFETLKRNFSGVVGYPNLDGTVKLAAGWLIEQCGPEKAVSWKGFRSGDAGCHVKQALVLVNYGNASGKEIFELSERIRKSVKEKFAVDLEREVNTI